MLYSIATSYALRALSALPEGQGYHLARELTDHLGLPGPYLSKILQVLAQEGVLESVRGPRGGYRLARPARRITIRQVVQALDGGAAPLGCPLGFVDCDGGGAPCPFHELWCDLKVGLERTLDLTIGDLQRLDLRSQGGQPRQRRAVRAPAAS